MAVHQSRERVRESERERAHHLNAMFFSVGQKNEEASQNNRSQRRHRIYPKEGRLFLALVVVTGIITQKLVNKLKKKKKSKREDLLFIIFFSFRLLSSIQIYMLGV